jgi:chromosome segregation ATPase
MTAEYPCIPHEEQIQKISRKAAELETRADYKDKRIDELKADMRDLKGSVESLDKTINDYIVNSIKDDNTLKDYITSLENRVTTIESRQDTLYKLLMAIPAILALLGLITVYIQFIH